MQANKYWLKKITVIIVLVFSFTSCVEEYWPELKKDNQQLLVIEGKITNLPGPYTIKLSTSSDVNDTLHYPLSSANVTIIDILGNSEILVETDPGIYKTSVNGIQGIIGLSYKIKVELNNGKLYESEFEEMLNPVEVEKVEVEESWRLAENSLENDEEGFQFYITTKQSESPNTYFFWEMEETYEYRSDYYIYFYYKGETFEPDKINFLGLPKMRWVDSLYYCWKTQKTTEHFSYSTEYLSVPTVNKLPLQFIPFTNEKLRYKYSSLTTQFTISERAYTFLKTLEKQNENQGTLFTSQPFQVRGNLVNTNNPDEPVLGYFMVAAGTKSNRLFVIAPPRVRYSLTHCEADTTINTIRNALNQYTYNNKPIYFTIVYLTNPELPDMEEVEAFAYVYQDCLDCTRKGGVTIKPDYWDW